MRLVLSYIFDWIVIIGIAAIAGGWEFVEPFRRPFSPVDLSISYPYQKSEMIPTWLLVVCSLIAPAGIIMIVCLVLVPGPTAERGTPKSLVWRRKLWEWHTGWMGLALALATAFLITQGMKNLFGKPRPDLLSRCKPNLDLIQEYAINSVGEVFDPSWVLVTSGICTQTDNDLLKDGFKSFPSGHASCKYSTPPPCLNYNLTLYSLMGRSSLPHPVPRLKVLRHNPTPFAPPILHKPSPHLGRLALQSQETNNPPPPQTRIRPLSQHRRHRSTHPLPKRRTARIHSSFRSRPRMRRHLHHQHALHRFPPLWIRLVVRHTHRD